MAVITKNSLVRNGSMLLGQAETTGEEDGWTNGEVIGASVTTGESSGFVDALVPVDSAVAFLVSWAGTSTAAQHHATVTVAAGESGRAWQRNLGAFTLELKSTNAWSKYRYLLGPFESARFGRKSTSQDKAVRITISSDTSDSVSSNLHVVAFQMPTVTYDT